MRRHVSYTPSPGSPRHLKRPHTINSRCRLPGGITLSCGHIRPTRVHAGPAFEPASPILEHTTPPTTLTPPPRSRNRDPDDTRRRKRPCDEGSKAPVGRPLRGSLPRPRGFSLPTTNLTPPQLKLPHASPLRGRKTRVHAAFTSTTPLSLVS